MFRHRKSNSSEFHDTGDYNDLSAFDWNEQFDGHRYDAGFDEAVYDEQYDEFGGNPDFDGNNVDNADDVDYYEDDVDDLDYVDIGDNFEGDENYEDDNMPARHHFRRRPQRKGLKRTIIAGVILIMLLLSPFIVFRFVFVPYESANYISSNSSLPIAWIKAYKTQQAHPQIYVEMTYRTARGTLQTLCAHFNSETFSMYGEWTEFAGFDIPNSTKGFRWITVDGQFSEGECQSKGQTLDGQGNSTFLNDSEDGLYRLVSNTPVISRFIGTASRSVFVGPITSTTSQNYVIYLSPNGTVTCALVR